jgi:hypothetical protein
MFAMIATITEFEAFTVHIVLNSIRNLAMDRQTFLRQVDELFELPPGTLNGTEALESL